MNETLNLQKQLIGLDGSPAVYQTSTGDKPILIKDVLLDALNVNSQRSTNLDSVEKVYKRGQVIEAVKNATLLPLTPQLVVLFETVLFETGQTPTTIFQILSEMGSDPTQ